MSIVDDRSHASQFIKRGTRPRVFKSNLIGKTEIAISGATDLQIGPSRCQNIHIDKCVIVKQYYQFGCGEGTELQENTAILLLSLCDVRGSKGIILSSRSRNLEVEDFLKRSLSFLHDFLSFEKVRRPQGH